MIAQSVLASITVTTGTFAYTYPETLSAIRPGLLLAHDISGDLLIAAGIAYLWIHLQRTWRLWKLALSWWTGLGASLAFIIVSSTGVYGQLAPMPSGGPVWAIHLAVGVAVTALACFHGAYGLRRRIR